MTRPIVYFHIDEVARDAVVAANLRRVLQARGADLIYGNRMRSEFFGWFDAFAAFDLYIFPSLDIFQSNCRDVDSVSAPVVILPSETVGGTTRNVDRLAAKYLGSFPDRCGPWTEKVAAFCVWGRSHLKAFDELAPGLRQKCHVVGHPRFDRRCRVPSSISVGGQKIRVGFISRFAALNPFDQRGILQTIYEGRKIPGQIAPMYRLSPDRDVEDRIYTESVDLRHIFEVMDSLNRSTHEMVLRTHPREDRTAWEKLIRTNSIPLKIASWDQPFLHWVNSVDYVIGPVSTSFYDCIVAGKRPICTMEIAPHRQSHTLAGGDDENPILNYVFRPKSVQELVGIVSTKPKSDYLEMPDSLAEILCLESNYPDCATSLDRVADVCLDVLRISAHNHRARLGARVKFNAFAMADLTYRAVRGRGREEQSSTFVLSPSRIRWINNLAFSN